MSLSEILKLPEIGGKTPSEVLAYGDQTTVIGGTDELWSYSGVAITFGDVAAEGLLQAIQGAGLAGAALVYTGKGMQLSLQSVQDKLTAIGSAVPALNAVCEALKEIGITHGTYWQLWEIARPTTEQIDAAIAANAERDAVTNFANETLNALISSGTKAEIKAAVGAW